MNQNLLFVLIILLNINGYSQQFPISMKIKKGIPRSYEIIILDSTDSHPNFGADLYYHSTTTISIKNDTLNKINFSHRYFGDVEAVPNGDSIISPIVNLSIKDNQFSLFVFFKTGQYGSKLYHFQGYIDPLTNFMFKPFGVNIIKNDIIEQIYYFNQGKSYCVYTYTDGFGGKIIRPFLVKDNL